MNGWLAAAPIGLMWGLIWGLCKYVFLWRPLFSAPKRTYKPRKGLLFRRGSDLSSLEVRMNLALGLALLMDVVCLFVLYWLRSLLPPPWTAGLIAAAIALSLSARLPLMIKARLESK